MTTAELAKPTIKVFRETETDHDLEGVITHLASISLKDHGQIGYVVAYQFGTHCDEDVDIYGCADAISADLEFVAARALGLNDGGREGYAYAVGIEDLVSPEACCLADAFVIIDRVHIDPAHRGQGYGPLAVETLLKRIKGDTLAVLYPCAQSDEPGQRLSTKAQAAADKKVKAAWGSIGFAYEPATGLMVRAD